MARRGENIHKRKDGRYEGRYIKYYDMNGKAVYGYVYSRSYAEIKEKLAKCRLDRQSEKPGSSMKLSAWLKIWFETQTFLKPTTQCVYESHIKNQIVPAIGKVPLRKLSGEVLQGFVNDLEVSASTAKTVFGILKSALSVAEDKGYITNVWSKVKLPKRNAHTIRILTQDEQKQLEKVLTSDEDIGIWLSLYAGLRIGEVCALKWENIDFKSASLTVTGTQTRTKKRNRGNLTQKQKLQSKNSDTAVSFG